MKPLTQRQRFEKWCIANYGHARFKEQDYLDSALFSVLWAAWYAATEKPLGRRSTKKEEDKMNDAIKEAERVISENESYLSFLEREGRGYEIDDLLQASQVLLAHAKTLQAKVEELEKERTQNSPALLASDRRMNEINVQVIASLRAERDALKKQLESDRTWQVINTAPKDGSLLLLAISNHESSQRIFVGQYNDPAVHEQKGWVVYGYWGISQAMPTHWRPLPSFPAEENNLQESESGTPRDLSTSEPNNQNKALFDSCTNLQNMTRADICEVVDTAIRNTGHEIAQAESISPKEQP